MEDCLAFDLVDLTTDEAARTSHAAYGYAIGMPFMPPDALDKDVVQKNKWRRFAEVAARSLHAAEDGVSVPLLAERIRREVLGLGPEGPDATGIEAVAWQAAVWHLARCIEHMEQLPRELMEGWEKTWAGWAAERRRRES